MTASLERSLISEDGDDDHNDEGGGRRSSSRIRANETQSFILRLKTNDIACPVRVHPTRLFSRGGQSIIDSRPLLLALVLVMVLVPIFGHAVGRKETIKSTHQARFLPYPPLLTPVHTGSGLRCPLVLPTGLRSFLLCHPFLPQAWVHYSFLRILVRHSLPQARALHSLKLQMIQQDCTSLYTAMRTYLHLPSQRDLIQCNSDPVGRCCQANNRDVPFLSCRITDNFSRTLLLSSAVVGGERKGEGLRQQ